MVSMVGMSMVIVPVMIVPVMIVTMVMAVVVAVVGVGMGVEGEDYCKLVGIGRIGEAQYSLPRRLTINPKELIMKRSSRRFVSRPSISRSKPSNIISTLIRLFSVSLEPDRDSPGHLH